MKSSNATTRLAITPFGETSTGLSPRVAAVLAYSGWWLSGGLFLVIETHPYVLSHARQAFYGLGGLWLIGFILWASSFVAVVVSAPVFKTTAVLAQVTWATAVLVWAYGMWCAWRGRTWVIPGFGP